MESRRKTGFIVEDGQLQRVHLKVYIFFNFQVLFQQSDTFSTGKVPEMPRFQAGQEEKEKCSGAAQPQRALPPQVTTYLIALFQFTYSYKSLIKIEFLNVLKPVRLKVPKSRGEEDV